MLNDPFGPCHTDYYCPQWTEGSAGAELVRLGMQRLGRFRVTWDIFFEHAVQDVRTFFTASPTWYQKQTKMCLKPCYKKEMLAAQTL